jgi:hypothetical protein
VKGKIPLKKRQTAKVPSDSQVGDGFYARMFSEEEIIDLESMLATGLDDEIAMLRVILRRYYCVATAGETLEDMGTALDRVSLVTTRLAALVKAQYTLKEQRRGEVSEFISKAIDIVNKEWNLSI